MKAILTGATGFVGSEVLKQLIDEPEITQVTCLVRRPLSNQTGKTEIILHSDFAVYDPELARRLAARAIPLTRARLPWIRPSLAVFKRRPLGHGWPLIYASMRESLITVAVNSSEC